MSRFYRVHALRCAGACALGALFLSTAALDARAQTQAPDEVDVAAEGPDASQGRANDAPQTARAEDSAEREEAEADTSAPERADTLGRLARVSSSCLAQFESLAEGGRSATGPLTLPSGTAAFGTARRVCPRSELGVAVIGGVEADVPAFRALASARLQLSGSYTLDARTELFATFEALRYGWGLNAALTGGRLRMGGLSAGASRSFDAPVPVALWGRVLLPVDGLTATNGTGGLELGASARWAALASLTLRGHAAGWVDAGIGAGAFSPRVGAYAGLGLEWQLGGAQLIAETVARFGRVDAFDNLAGNLGARFGLTERLEVELALGLRLLGERGVDPGGPVGDALLAAHLRWRL